MGEEMEDAWMPRWANQRGHQHGDDRLRDGWVTGQVMGSEDKGCTNGA